MTGIFVYKQTAIQQHEDVAIPFTELFKKILPTQIIEIGTASGGLTILIRDILDSLGLEDTTINTYDVHSNNFIVHRVSKEAKINIHTKNIFNHVYNDLIDEERGGITALTQLPGPTIVLCDGGSKKNEFNIFAKILKPNDIIMAHDYAPSHKFFTENILHKIWNWHEICDKDIEAACNDYNLVPFMGEEFKKVVWVCKQKI